MTAGRWRDPVAAGIGALLLGLLATPWVYVGFGAFSAFPPSFAAVATPLLIVATLNLGLEAFGRLRGFRIPRLVGALLSAIVLLVILSGLMEIALAKSKEAGLLATLWLGASTVWLVVSLPLGEVGPEAILRSYLSNPVPRRIALVVANILFTVLVVLSWCYLTTPSAFIG
ncbi:MAG: hypothetical protein LGR52_15940 [Candidatus Thiosymbion ectosymbiont of Robbea hypermnestra]|nr:hypothetical protein [Candidatus Thiosymbion ectosymbiont of Robbea hypermnestra]